MRNIMFYVAAVVIAAAGCSKVADLQTSSNDIQIEFAVAERPDFGAATKAVKTEWAVGDEIAIAFQPADEAVVTSMSTGILNGRDCELVTLTRTESGWTSVANGTIPVGEGTYYAVHHRGSVTMKVISGSATNVYNLGGYKGGELMSFTGTYTMDTELKLDLGTLELALDSRLFQISVRDELFTQEYANIYLSECIISGTSDILDNPEKTVTLSIYKNWTYSSDAPVPTTLLANHVALSSGAVSLNFEDSQLFVYSTEDKYKTKAAAVLNHFVDEYDWEDFDYSFCFADLTTGKVMAPTNYIFYVERTEEAGADYTIDENLKVLYQTVQFDKDARNLKKGRSYRLSNQDWSNL